MDKDSVLAPSYKIEVDGNDLSPKTRANVRSVSFEEELNSASMFSLTLTTTDANKGEWNYLDLKAFMLGSEIKIYMGYDKPVLMIDGELTSLEPFFGQDTSTINIRGYDRMHRLGLGKKSRTYKNVKDSDIASTIAGDWGLSTETDSSKTLYPHIFQNNQSDLEFLLNRAKRINYELAVKGKTLSFRKSRENEGTSLKLEYKVDFNTFSARLKPQYAGNEIVVQGWDVMKKQSISASATEGGEISKMTAKETGSAMTQSAFGETSSAIVTEPVIDISEAENIAIAKYNTQVTESVTGDGTCDGRPELRAGKTIELTGIDRFRGIYYVTATTHSINLDGYNSTFKVRRVGI